MEKMYFCERPRAYGEWVEDAWNWWMAGYRPGELTVEDILNEYEVDWMTQVDAYEAQKEDEVVYSAEELCEDMNRAMEEYEDPDNEDI